MNYQRINAESHNMSESDFDFRYNIQPGRHLYQFYKGIEDYVKVVVPFLRAGLEKGEACLWLVSSQIDLDEVMAYMEEEIPRLLFYVSSGQLTIRSAEEWYLTEGHFDEGRALQNAIQFGNEIQKKGFHRVRMAGDAGVIPHEDWLFLKAYEEKSDQIIKASQAIVLCCYPILGCDLHDTKMVLECHDNVLMGRL
ncbi:MAG: MEDS domain-containing protein [Candidatus Omnitrophica bacterium]|nr:MEDS domain-containing protein [Candidatus Omnitrophota bacterium]